MIRPKLTPKRSVERLAVTIIAGFRSYQGIVVCADTQETIGESKRNVPKLIFKPSSIGKDHTEGTELAAAFCGAGNGPFIDKIVDRTWQDIENATSLDEACTLAIESIENSYKHFGNIYQPGFVPEVELIFGVKMDDDSRLFTSVGPIVNEKKTYESSGTGIYLANFLCARMYKEHLTLRQCVILAAYVLFQAKEHVNGCGGDSQIAVLRNDGVSGIIDWQRVEAMTKLLQGVDQGLGELLFDVGDLNKTDHDIGDHLQTMMDVVKTYREDAKAELKKHEEFWYFLGRAIGGKDFKVRPKDEYGLPMPSDDQK
jgi:hypothetical protein